MKKKDWGILALIGGGALLLYLWAKKNGSLLQFPWLGALAPEIPYQSAEVAAAPARYKRTPAETGAVAGTLLSEVQKTVEQYKTVLGEKAYTAGYVTGPQVIMGLAAREEIPAEYAYSRLIGRGEFAPLKGPLTIFETGGIWTEQGLKEQPYYGTWATGRELVGPAAGQTITTALSILSGKEAAPR